VARTSAVAVAGLVRAAATGDERAWQDLVRRLEPELRRVVKRYRLSPHDVDDVLQTMWLLAFTNLRRLRDPAALAGWLVVVARRESLRALQHGTHEILAAEPPEPPPDPATPEGAALARERSDVLDAAIARLSGRQRTVAQALLVRPWHSYEQLSAELAMPVGSIGPTRERAFRRLRADLDLAEVASS
jgi:RNA polymerase sigma factor (sigma-70 family)